MRIPLTGGAYQSRSFIASAQECLNLYAEQIPPVEGEPSKFVYFPTPGLTLRHTMSTNAPIRGLYYSTNYELYVVAGGEVWFLDRNFTETHLGSLTTTSGPVSMIDNTVDLVIVDSSTTAIVVEVATGSATSLNPSVNYNGSNRVDFLDTFFLFNEPVTPQFYCSDSLSTIIDPLYFANKSGAPDYLTAVVEARGTVWLIGANTSEPWTDSGASDFPFQKLPGILIEHGCGAYASIAKADGSIFLLGQDIQGHNTVMQFNGYNAKIISTPAISDAINGYSTTMDATGYTYQQEGHTFYVLTFPTGDETWVYDESNEQWHKWASQDSSGNFHRHRSSCYADAYGLNLVGDYQNGNIYSLDLNNYTDNGVPITRRRSFPHIINDGKRVSYSEFSADVECGNLIEGAVPNLMLDWSDDRGATFGTPLTQGFDAQGTLTQPKWSRLGLARDRVFRLSWDSATRTALQGAWIDVKASGT